MSRSEVGLGANGRAAVVTGGSRGIGRATPIRLARDGYRVFFTYRQAAGAEATRALLSAEGLDGEALAVDLERPDSVDRLFDRVEAASGTLDILVLNAASTALKPVVDLKAHHFERTFAVTVAATLHCIGRAAPLMGQGASVVFVSGIDTRRFFPGHALLAAAKTAAETLVRYLAVELGPRGIRANCVVPGLVDTDSARSYGVGAFGSFEAFKERWGGRAQLSRTTTADEIAGVVSFLCSSAARSITGQSIVVDGGYSLS